MRGNFRVNNGLAEREAALNGLGICVTPTFYVGSAIGQGHLQVVLNGYLAHELTIHAVYPQRKYLQPKVRAFIEFLARRFGPEPYWDRF